MTALHYRLTFVLFVLLAVAAGCTTTRPPPATPAETSPQTAAEPPPAPTAPTLAEAGNATFEGIYEQPITLVDGRWEGEPFVADGAARPMAGIAEDFYLTGDLNGDGSPEAVVLVWESSGGSGSYGFVAALGRRDGVVTTLGVAGIGDRAQIMAARLSDELIVLDIVQQAPDDAACCPTQKTHRTWTLSGDGLMERPVEVLGTLSTADLEGVTWQLIQLSESRQALANAPITLELQGDRIAGQAPCNRYFAGVETGDYAGALIVGAAGLTSMACPDDTMTFEREYLQALSGVRRYSFWMGKLALTWQHDDTFGTMLFEAAR